MQKITSCLFVIVYFAPQCIAVPCLTHCMVLDRVVLVDKVVSETKVKRWLSSGLDVVICSQGLGAGGSKHF
jgi:hypothetical protein